MQLISMEIPMQVVADWSVQNLGFASFKTRGELLLKGAETAEVVSLMEDSLMVLGSLMSNRYSYFSPNAVHLQPQHCV